MDFGIRAIQVSGYSCPNFVGRVFFVWFMCGDKSPFLGPEFFAIKFGKKALEGGQYIAGQFFARVFLLFVHSFKLF